MFVAEVILLLTSLDSLRDPVTLCWSVSCTSYSLQLSIVGGIVYEVHRYLCIEISSHRDALSQTNFISLART